MLREFAVLGGVAALVLGLFAAESRTCAFGRRHRRDCAPVYYDPCPPMAAADPKSEEAICRVLDDWYDAASKADAERYLGHMAEASVFLGTDATERWDKKAFRAFVEPRFREGKGWTYRATKRAVVLAEGGSSPWFDEQLESKHGPTRGTGVLVRQPDGWRIAHYSLSFLVPNDVAPAVEKIIAAQQPPAAERPDAPPESN